MSDPDTPRDPFAVFLRDAGARILATQHAREPGAAAALLADVPQADHGDARRSLDVLDPAPPAPSETITPELLRAAEYIQTADDEGERREAVRRLRAALAPPAPATPPVPVAVCRVMTGDPPAPVAVDSPSGSGFAVVLPGGGPQHRYVSSSFPKDEQDGARVRNRRRRLDAGTLFPR